jgi:hypothetical protein
MLRSRLARVLALAGVVVCVTFPVPAAHAHAGTATVAADPDVARLEAAAPSGQPGAPGVGDPYFPLEGNGGYDVRHYDFSFSYDPATDRLDGTMVVRARATKDLSRFDLDLQQLDVSAVRVNDNPAAYHRDGQELQITPHHRLRRGSTFTAAVPYGGIPQTVAVDPTIIASNPTAVDFFYDTTAEATDLWAKTFGPYPFDSTGAIADKPPTTGSPSASRWRPRPGRSTRRSAPPARSRTSWRTCGSATASRSRNGSTSGSTRASPPTSSTCGPST